jgi:predicted anti-sigma-YlaC factor YlaD
MTMTRHPRGVLCERARAWAALAPDGELSELERKLLGSHLDRCVGCSMFATEVAAIAAELRVAAPQTLGRPISVPYWRRRSAYARLRTAGAAAAVALMAVGVAARAPLTATERETLDLPRVTNFSNTAPEREVELINRRTQNEIAGAARFRPNREGLVTRPI